MSRLVHALALLIVAAAVAHAVPATPQYFPDQIVDHFSAGSPKFTQV
jgi:hypothetical protein